METGSVFYTNKTQAVRLPANQRFPDDVKKVVVRRVGFDIILSPIEKSWDRFFNDPDLGFPEDFEREDYIETPREEF